MGVAAVTRIAGRAQAARPQDPSRTPPRDNLSHLRELNSVPTVYETVGQASDSEGLARSDLIADLALRVLKAASTGDGRAMAMAIDLAEHVLRERLSAAPTERRAGEVAVVAVGEAVTSIAKRRIA